MGALRTKKAHERYLKLIAEGFLSTNGCKICKAPVIKNFKYWKIIKNKFPYDLISKVNDIILPKRHVTEDKLNNLEKKEFALIKKTYIEKNYEAIIEVTNRQKSIPSHFHVHLIVMKDPK